MVCNASNSNKKKQLLYNNRVKLLPTPPPHPVDNGSMLAIARCRSALKRESFTNSQFYLVNATQAFSQTLKTGRPEGLLSHKISRD